MVKVCQSIFDLKGDDSELVHGIYTLGKNLCSKRIESPSLALTGCFFLSLELGSRCQAHSFSAPWVETGWQGGVMTGYLNTRCIFYDGFFPQWHGHELLHYPIHLAWSPLAAVTYT